MRLPHHRRRCEVCSAPRPLAETYEDASEHLRRCVPALAEERGLAGLLLAYYRMDAEIRRSHEIIARLLAVEPRQLERAKRVEILRQFGGRAELDSLVLAIHGSAERRTLDRMARDSECELRSEKVNGRVVYVVADQVEDDAVPAGTSTQRSL